MQKTDKLKHPDIDLYTLHLVRLVAKHRGFTPAALESALSQSALTRQVKGAEERLGFSIFERTTREVKITEAGAILLRETQAIPNILNNALRRINEETLNKNKVIKIGISSEISHAYIPGFFDKQLKRNREVKYLITQYSEHELKEKLHANALDLAFMTDTGELSPEFSLQHEIKDDFIIISNSQSEIDKNHSENWFKQQQWLLPPPHTKSRELIDKWAIRNGIGLNPSMEIENFDLMSQLVMLDLGLAFIPRRSISSIKRKHRIQKIQIPFKLSRKLVIVTPNHNKPPAYVEQFIQNILFS